MFTDRSLSKGFSILSLRLWDEFLKMGNFEFSKSIFSTKNHLKLFRKWLSLKNVWLVEQLFFVVEFFDKHIFQSTLFSKIVPYFYWLISRSEWQISKIGWLVIKVDVSVEFWEPGIPILKGVLSKSPASKAWKLVKEESFLVKPVKVEVFYKGSSLIGCWHHLSLYGNSGHEFSRLGTWN